MMGVCSRGDLCEVILLMFGVIYMSTKLTLSHAQLPGLFILFLLFSYFLRVKHVYLSSHIGPIQFHSYILIHIPMLSPFF